MRKPLNLQSETAGIFSRISRDRDELRPFCCGQLSLHSHSLVHSTDILACPHCVTQCSQCLGQKHAASAPEDFVEETGVSLSLFRWQKIKVPRPPLRCCVLPGGGEAWVWEARRFQTGWGGAGSGVAQGRTGRWQEVKDRARCAGGYVEGFLSGRTGSQKYLIWGGA